ncbi:MAG: TatD family hydrolase [Prevotella sp.]|nr:TatD family hydrolase [Prevotella sp.]MCM1075068.1 TatD family hydrolase [Ruminococcus sp.]
MRLIDCHTHKQAPYPQGVISTSPDASLMPGQAYSLGIHPWYIPVDPSDLLARLDKECLDSQVLAIGETGLDSKCATPMWLQVNIFKHHIKLSEWLGKPLIIHCVKTVGEIVQMRKAVGAVQPWIIHGFRGKPSVLEMLMQAGCFVSYGEKFNAESLALTPKNKLLAETDESLLSIEEVIRALSATRGENLLPSIEQNMSTIFRII